MSDINDGFDEFGDLDDFEEFGEFDDDGGFDEPEELTPQQERRLAKFQQNVQQAMRIVTNEKVSVSKRVKAAQWLGESGEPTAIASLRQAYLDSSDKKIKNAAEESLGKFRALKESLDDPNKAPEVGQLLQDIIFKGKTGSVSGAVRIVARLQKILVVTFVLFLVVGVLANAGLLKDPNALPTVVPTPTINVPDTPIPTVPATDILDEILTLHDDLVFDAELLAERFQLSIQERDLGCGVTEFRAREEYIAPSGFVPDSFPYVAEFIDKLNTARTELETLRASYDTACETLIPISVEDANTQWELLIPLQSQINTEFVELLENPSFIPGETIATPTPRASPTPFPTATIEPSLINQKILTIEFNLDDMNLDRGHNTLLIQFWTDLETAGTTDACRDEQPLLPEDYLITEEDRIDLPIDLINAIEAYNLGMALSRESWLLFSTACNSESPEITQGKSKAELAQATFDSALESLLLLKE
jgi:hypothetical protein